MAWAPGATVWAISAKCRFIASVLQAGRTRLRPCPVLDRPRQRCRWRRCAGHAVRLGGCRASPSGG